MTSEHFGTTSVPPAGAAGQAPAVHRASLAALSLGALGVVFGDIGTSPLYTLKECLLALSSAEDQAEGLFGVLSLMFWALVMVVTVKYAISSCVRTTMARAVSLPCSPSFRSGFANLPGRQERRRPWRFWPSSAPRFFTATA